MSKQLTLSSIIAVLATAATALIVTADLDQAPIGGPALTPFAQQATDSTGAH